MHWAERAIGEQMDSVWTGCLLRGGGRGGGGGGGKIAQNLATAARAIPIFAPALKKSLGVGGGGGDFSFSDFKYNNNKKWGRGTIMAMTDRWADKPPVAPPLVVDSNH